MIDYIIVRNTNCKKIGIVDAFTSIIWNVVFYGVGTFEIYAPFDSNNAELLQINNYVSRYDRRDIGIIENVNITYVAGGALMITASGRFAKSILDRRLIYKMRENTITPVVFSGNVEAAARSLVNRSIINATDGARNVPFIELGAVAGLSAKLENEQQTSFGNLLEITDNLLYKHQYGAYMKLNESTLKLQYIVFAGQDRTKGTKNPLIFSQEFDNLLSNDYTKYNTNEKNVALCGGAGEGVERKFVLVYDNDEIGIGRRELFVDGSNNSETYENDDGETETYPVAEYLAMLRTTARQELSQYKAAEEIDGELDITTSGLEFENDYNVGDIVTIVDNVLNIETKSRIIEVNEVQDGGGYSVNIKVENSNTTISGEALTTEAGAILITGNGKALITRWV